MGVRCYIAMKCETHAFGPPDPPGRVSDCDADVSAHPAQGATPSPATETGVAAFWFVGTPMRSRDLTGT